MDVKTLKAKTDGGGIKRSWLADKMGVSQTLLSLWFSGEREMTSEQESKADNIMSELGAVPA